MKWVRLEVWVLLSGLVFFSDAGNAFARSACDNWLQADTRIQILEEVRERLWEREGELNRKVDDVRAHGDPGYDQEIAQLKGQVRQKPREVEAKRQELRLAKNEANMYAPDLLQAKIAKAQKKIKEGEIKVKKIDLALESKLGNDQEVSQKRTELKKVKEEFQSLFGKRTSEEVRQLLSGGPPANAPIFEKTLVTEIGRALSRKSGGFTFVSTKRAINARVGAALDELTEEELRTRDITERKRLLGLAKNARDLPGELKRKEDKVLGKGGSEKRAERARIVANIAKAKVELAQAKRDLKSGKYPEKLAEVQQLQRELTALENELKKLEQDLEQKKSKSPLEVVKAELNHVQSELAQINNDLKNLKKHQTDLKQQLGAMAEHLSALAEVARASGSRALKVTREGNASVCQESRNVALDALKEASALAAQNRACLDPSVLERLNNGFHKAEAIDCGAGPQPTGLIVVPSVTYGMTQDEARGLLNSAGLTKIFFSEYRMPEKPEDVGKVITVSPPPGQMVSLETLIVVSTFNNQWQDPKKADDKVIAATADGGAWDKEADKARVSATTHTTVMPDTPTGSASQPDSSQVDRAREVAKEATAMGPQSEPIITPEALVGGIAFGTGIIRSTKTTGRGTTTSGSPTASTGGGGRRDCTIHHSGSTGDAYYVIDMGGSPKGFEIRKVWDPPRGDADRQQCGGYRGAMKKCIDISYKQLGRPVLVHGPFDSLSRAEKFAKGRCR